MTWEEVKKALEPIIGDNTELIEILKEYENTLTEASITTEELEELKAKSEAELAELEQKWKEKFKNTFFGKEESGDSDSDVVIDNGNVKPNNESNEEILIKDLFN